MKLTQDQLYSFVRWLVTGICGWLLTKGYIADEWVPGIIGVALAVASLAWSMWTHTPAQQLQAVKRLDPNIKVEVPQQVLDEHPSVKQFANANPAFMKVVGRDQWKTPAA
jgi:hypothetical protein